jgi:hypothetical protein
MLTGIQFVFEIMIHVIVRTKRKKTLKNLFKREIRLYLLTEQLFLFFQNGNNNFFSHSVGILFPWESKIENASNEYCGATNLIIHVKSGAPSSRRDLEGLRYFIAFKILNSEIGRNCK